MNTSSNVLDDFSPAAAATAPVAIPAGRRFYWSVRRELWENRSLYLAPLALGALMLAGFLLGVIHLRVLFHRSGDLAITGGHGPMNQPFEFAALGIMAIEFLIAVFYCLDALYGERRDRSILFWKSLPVSDLTAVLAKATIPVLVLPLIAFAVTIVTQAAMLLLGTAVLLGSGLSPAALGFHASLLSASFMLLYHLLIVHGLWYAPLYGWLLLVSAWARRAPFLWAVLPLLAMAVVEKIAFNTSYFAKMLGDRFGGGPPIEVPGRAMSMDALTPSIAGHFLVSPGMWIGLALAAAFVAAAVRLRRYRTPI